MIKYATIGRGKIAKQFIEGAEISGRFELGAVYSRSMNSGRQFAKEQNCNTVYSSLTELANDKSIQAVYVASPNSFHVEQSRIMIEAGKHVICEKPIAASALEYKTLKQLADQNGVIYMEAIIPRYTEFRGLIKNALSQIGKITLARIDYCQRSSRYDAFCLGEIPNVFDMSLAGGALMDLGVYCVYAAVDLFGNPNNITAKASFLRNNADGAGCAIFEYNDFLALLSYGKTGQSNVASEIVGDQGSIIINRIGLYSDAFLVKGKTKTPLTREYTKQQLMSMEASRFADFISGERIEDYKNASELCLNVHTCMDKIKHSAGIKYN